MTVSGQRLDEFWTDTLKRDLAGFADPGMDVLVEPTGSTITAMWTQRGRVRSASFRLTQDGDFRWIAAGTGAPRTYREFLCSDGMADFEQLAQAILRAFPRANHYLETRAVVDRNGTPNYESSHQVLLSTSSRALTEPLGKTQMLFLKGDAGAGKTTLLREVTRQQAERYLSGHSPFLFLYISAQGRALSNLRDALSGELDDLRAGFTRDAVPPLVRQGLIVPIIDGFDELLGAAGYGDAFGSLHQFLEQVDGLGVVMVSARTSFYDVEFIGRELTESTRTSAYDIVPVTLLAWREEEVAQYLARVRGQQVIRDQDREAIADLSPRDRDLLAKPFFASLFPDYVDSPEGRSKGTSLVEYLVSSYVRRESEKIVDRDGRPLLDIKGHRQIFTLTAEFMWAGEKRDFSADDLRTVAELVAYDQKLASDSAKQLVTKITSYAGFRTSRQGTDQRFQFEHEVYLDHFLSEALRSKMRDSAELASFLNGGLLAEEVIAAVVDKENASRWLDLLDGLRRTSALHENLRRNAGTLAAACFRAASTIMNRTIEYCQFVNTSFGEAQFEGVEFKGCRFVGVRLERARFRECRTSECVAESLVLSGSGQIGIAGLVPGENLYCVVDVATGEEIFSPSEMRRLLHAAGMPAMEEARPQVTYSRQAQSIIDLLQRVLRKYRQSNLLCLEDDRLIRLFQDPSWPTLHRLMVRHQIVAEETRQASGSRKTFLRYRVSLPDLMLLERQPNLPPGALGDFWRGLRAIR